LARQRGVRSWSRGRKGSGRFPEVYIAGSNRPRKRRRLADGVCKPPEDFNDRSSDQGMMDDRVVMVVPVTPLKKAFTDRRTYLRSPVITAWAVRLAVLPTRGAMRCW